MTSLPTSRKPHPKEIRAAARTPEEAAMYQRVRREVAAQRQSTRERREALVKSETGLRPWMKKLAAWYAVQPLRPKQRDVLQTARYLSKYQISTHTVKMILARPEFTALVHEISESEVKRARAMLEGQMPDAIETHYNAMKRLEDQGEFADLSKFTAPYIDRAWPRRDDAIQPPTVVVLKLGEGKIPSLLHQIDDRPEIIIEPEASPSE